MAACCSALPVQVQGYGRSFPAAGTVSTRSERVECFGDPRGVPRQRRSDRHRSLSSILTRPAAKWTSAVNYRRPCLLNIRFLPRSLICHCKCHHFIPSLAAVTAPAPSPSSSPPFHHSRLYPLSARGTRLPG